MRNVSYKIGSPKDFSTKEKELFLAALIKQGKIRNATIKKLENCKLICICFVNDVIASIGAIKPKTKSDFNLDKANIIKFSTSFEWEIGYCFTESNCRGQGFSSSVVKMLIAECGEINLMASTEVKVGNSMVNILEKNFFKQYGQLWKSSIHGGALGLYLKFVK